MRTIKKIILHEEIADNLKEMIMVGELKEGNKIKEDDFCASMGISKTPLREALRVLSTEGLIKHVPNRGSYVSKPSFEEIKEMFDVMSALEGVCARTAAEKMTNKELSQLEKLHKKLEENFERKDRKTYIHYNNLYHTFLQEIAGNRTLNNIVNGLRQKILLHRFQSLNLPERFEESINEHRKILETFRKKDSKKAEALMMSHLKKACNAIEKQAK